VAPSPADAADALALAIAHAWRRGPALQPPAQAAGAVRAKSPGRSGATGVTAAQKLWREAEAKAKKNKEKTGHSWR
jgi:crossover junction endodeoxyribonuclease RuvC